MKPKDSANRIILAFMALGATMMFAEDLSIRKEKAFAVENEANAFSGGKVAEKESFLSTQKLGIFDVHPHFGVDLRYDNNIFLRSSGEEDDFISTLSPGLSLTLGDYRDRAENFLILDYTPSGILHLNHDELNSLDHRVQIAAQYRFPKLTLGFTQLIEAISENRILPDDRTNLEAGNRVERQRYITVLTGRTDLATKMSLDLSATQAISEFDDATLFDNREWSTLNWINYNYSPKTSFGLGVGLGYIDINNNPNQVYEQLLGRMQFQPVEKIKLELSAGMDARQSEGDSRDRFTPIFRFTGIYNISDARAVYFEAYRRVASSISVQNQQYTATGFSMGVRQRIYQKFFASLGVGYEQVDYEGVVSNVTATRSDNYIFVRPGVEYEINDHWKAGVYYLYRNNDSNQGPASFEDHQIGFELTMRF